MNAPVITLSADQANLLIARAGCARDLKLITATAHRQYVTMVTYGLENQKLATRRNGDKSNGAWIQRLRTGAVQGSATLIHLLEAFPFWEWDRKVGTYPDEVKWDAQYGRWQMLVDKHGCAPTWDIDREAYDWGREQQMRGRKGVGARRAALLDQLPCFEWTTMEARATSAPTRRQKSSYAASAAASPGGTRWRPEGLNAPRGKQACQSEDGPSGRAPIVPPADLGFAANPHEWCRTNIADLMLREENYTLSQVAGFAGVSAVAVHLWLKDATGLGLKQWRTTNGWPTPTLAPARAARIVTLRDEFPGEPVKAFARRLGVSERLAREALATGRV
jgi:hypothetical protein